MVLGYVSVYQLTWLSIALLLCAAAEVWGRWRFYGRYAQAGLWAWVPDSLMRSYLQHIVLRGLRAQIHI